MIDKRIIIVSDIHNCHIDWYGVKTRERMERLSRDLNAEYAKEPYEMILFLGDYSLDHWKWQVQGSYLKEGRSYTREYIEEFGKTFPAPYYMIAGNHEQYGDAKWLELTGCHRQFSLVCGDYLFVMLDSYGADLDPTEHSDGTFTPMDVGYVRGEMSKHPDKKVILTAHHFDFARETEEGRALITDKRIVCMFSGHVHLSDIITLPEELGGKNIVRTGHYSYTGSQKASATDMCMWGFRELYLSDDGIRTEYITPENRIVVHNESITVPYRHSDRLILSV